MSTSSGCEWRMLVASKEEFLRQSPISLLIFAAIEGKDR